ncbi:HK97 family phage prohead protease [Williamsia muralis]|uniref:HK97 family phage prohead protease n=1 Tax=Williamsia marianensis TaxID=85044 RepID=A0ABU4EXQ7_WILMA|nr:HK97 family phage prohead protease [Williamsia muralis]MDV7136028.1 HK97 family phage prohead protease [Williamsia muralis]
MTTALDYWAWRFAKARTKADGNAGHYLDLEAFWALGRGAVLSAWGYRDDLERCTAALAPKLGGDTDRAVRMCQHYRTLAIGEPRRLGENAKLPELPAGYDLDAEEPADALPNDDEDTSNGRRGRRSDAAKAELPGVRLSRPRPAGGAHNRPHSGGTLERGDLAMKHKDFDLGKIKAGTEDGLGEGEFDAYASTWDVKDSYGDVMTRGSFGKSIETWRKSGNAIPLLWAHDSKNPHAYIGEVLSMTEDERGLKVRGRIDLDSETGAQVHRLVKGRRVTMLSFGYDELRVRPVKADPRFGDHKALDEVHVHEISLVPIGANRETAVLAVKSEPTGPSVKAWEAYFTAAKFGPVAAPV